VTTAQPVVGFVGLGAMGSRMAHRLIASGSRVIVYNRSAPRAEPFRRLDVEVAETPAQLVEQADVVCGCLLDGAAVEEVYAGAAGLITASRARQLFIEHGTFDPCLAEEIARRLDERGALFLDAPVSGGPERAEEGTLTAMVGGTTDGVARGVPVIEQYATTIRHVGPSGAGLKLKLINQILVSCHVAAAAEATALIGRLDLALDVAAEILTSGWASSTMLERTLEKVRLNQLDESEATIGGLVEPQALAQTLAGQAGLSLPVFGAAIELFRAACASGHGTHDLAALAAAVDTTAPSLGRQE
jgi:3-hydroxyisobutyrate dehydrogenase-like beta-hydroxyacid dehydrogenase